MCSSDLVSGRFGVRAECSGWLVGAAWSVAGVVGAWLSAGDQSVAGPALSISSVVQSVFYPECAAVWCDSGWFERNVADLPLSSVERGWL